MLYKYIKRIIDFFLAFVGLILLLPILIIVTVLLSFINNGRPFFMQTRPGKGGRLFKIIKFKTMTDQKDLSGELLPDNKRLSKVGGIVRKLSLDEIPQLINVIIGDMSLIGPRPLLPQYLPLYSEHQNQRHDIKPGITGWAQVNGRNAISWKEKFELDVWYVKNYNFSLDLKIIYLTILKIFKREGVNSSENMTMESFKGNH